MLDDVEVVHINEIMGGSETAAYLVRPPAPRRVAGGARAATPALGSRSPLATAGTLPLPRAS
jgi:hypothetical protein